MMQNRIPWQTSVTRDQILDLLLDALVERQKAQRTEARRSRAAPGPPPRPEPPPGRSHPRSPSTPALCRTRDKHKAKALNKPEPRTPTG